MEKVYANLVQLGIKRIEEVDERVRDAVISILASSTDNSIEEDDKK